MSVCYSLYFQFAKLARDLRENPPDGLFFSGGSSAKNSAAAAANESEEEYPEGLLWARGVVVEYNSF